MFTRCLLTGVGVDMLHVPVGANSYGLMAFSYGTARPSSSIGTSVTPGTGSKGSWASVQSALSYDAYGLLICTHTNSQSLQSRNTIMDIGVDPAGGSSFSVVIPDLICGSAVSNYSSIAPGGTWYFFPLFIPAGASIGARAQGSVTTAFRVFTAVQSQPPNPSMIRKGSFVETLGISGITGVSVTPGTTGQGSWVSIGTTSKRLWWWQVGMQNALADTSWGTAAIHLDVAVGDGSNKDKIIDDLIVTTTTVEQIGNAALTAGVEMDVPGGSTMYARAWTSSSSSDSPEVAVYGCGG